MFYIVCEKWWKKVEERKLSGNQYLVIERYNQTLLPCSIRAVTVNNSHWRLAIWSVNYLTRHLLLYSIWPVTSSATGTDFIIDAWTYDQWVIRPDTCCLSPVLYCLRPAKILLGAWLSDQWVVWPHTLRRDLSGMSPATILLTTYVINEWAGQTPGDLLYLVCNTVTGIEYRWFLAGYLVSECEWSDLIRHLLPCSMFYLQPGL